jgi:hypothetical protein
MPKKKRSRTSRLLSIIERVVLESVLGESELDVLIELEPTMNGIAKNQLPSFLSSATACVPDFDGIW